MSRVCKSFKHKPTGVLIHAVYTDQSTWFSYKEILTVFKLETSNVAMQYYHSNMASKHKRKIHAVTHAVTTATQRIFVNMEGARDFVAKFVLDFGVAKRFIMFLKEIENALIALYIDVSEKNMFDYYEDGAKAYYVSGTEFRIINRSALINADKAYMVRWTSINGVDYYDHHSICKSLNLKPSRRTEPYHKYLKHVPEEGTMYLSKRAFKGARIFPTACNSATVLTYEGVLGFLDNIDIIEARALKEWFISVAGKNKQVIPPPVTYTEETQEQPTAVIEYSVTEMPEETPNISEETVMPNTSEEIVMPNTSEETVMPNTRVIELIQNKDKENKDLYYITFDQSTYRRDVLLNRLSYILNNGPTKLVHLAKLEDVSTATIYAWMRRVLKTGLLYWCDDNGAVIHTNKLKKARSNGGSHVYLTTKAKLLLAEEDGYTLKNPETLPKPVDVVEPSEPSVAEKLEEITAKLDLMLEKQDRFEQLLTKMDTLIDVLREQKATTFPDTIVLDFKRAVTNQ